MGARVTGAAVGAIATVSELFLGRKGTTGVRDGDKEVLGSSRRRRDGPSPTRRAYRDEQRARPDLQALVEPRRSAWSSLTAGPGGSCRSIVEARPDRRRACGIWRSFLGAVAGGDNVPAADSASWGTE